MKRCRTGILGVKKDPKNQILFSFSAREGEEWPSDDSDSDFVPSDEEDSHTKRCVICTNMTCVIHGTVPTYNNNDQGWVDNK
jgi:hypothetical protein